MLIYKIFRRSEWDDFRAAGETLGAPVDLVDGYIHISTAAQVAETAEKHFAQESNLVLVALDADALGPALKWEPSRREQLFPHLYRALTLSDVVWDKSLPLGATGHIFPRGAVVSLREAVGLALLHRVDPERAHGLSLTALRLGLAPLPGPVALPRLATHVAGMDLLNPVGLAAGYDKNAVALSALQRAGFGFLEVGAATPRPQDGNPRPRLFRLSEDRAAINRFGFNNEGAAQIAARLAMRSKSAVPVGLNLGANKDSADRAADFAAVLAACGPHADFATVNVSSPNTEKLRELQGRAALASLLAGVMEVRAALARPIPVFLKIAPDLSEPEIAEIAEVALTSGVAGIIATNTTLSREGLKAAARGETGGLSGAPLFEKSTRVLAQLSRATEGRLPLIGVGGIGSGEQAYQKIRAGASAVQIYTAMVYQGLSMIPRVARELDAALERDGFASVNEAVGTGRDAWL